MISIAYYTKCDSQKTPKDKATIHIDPPEPGTSLATFFARVQNHGQRVQLDYHPTSMTFSLIPDAIGDGTKVGAGRDEGSYRIAFSQDFSDRFSSIFGPCAPSPTTWECDGKMLVISAKPLMLNPITRRVHKSKIEEPKPEPIQTVHADPAYGAAKPLPTYSPNFGKKTAPAVEVLDLDRTPAEHRMNEFLRLGFDKAGALELLKQEILAGKF